MPKIPALPPITAPDAADLLPIEDVSANTTKSITLTKLKEWFQALTTFVTSTMVDWATMTGWQTETATWTYNAANKFTVPGDQTARYSKGTRLKWTQTTVKYGVVIASSYAASVTTVTIATNTDYTIANAAISANYYSYVVNPQGYPPYFSFTGVVTVPGGTVPTYSTNSCKFSITGGLVTVGYYLNNAGGGTAGAGAVPVYIAAPTPILLGARSGYGTAYNGGTLINGQSLYDFYAVIDVASGNCYLSGRGYNILGSDQSNATRYIQYTLIYIMA